jgi:hypothetical protein
LSLSFLIIAWEWLTSGGPHLAWAGNAPVQKKELIVLSYQFSESSKKQDLLSE